MQFLKPFSWSEYSPKMVEKITRPIAAGSFSTGREGIRLAKGVAGSYEKGTLIVFFLLVDESDGIIADAKFQGFCETPLVAAAEILCELVLRKNYMQAKRMTAEVVEKHVETKSRGFPPSTHGHINLALEALEDAVDHCLDIPLPKEFLETPVDLTNIDSGRYPDWAALSHEERIATISHVIASDVLPYVELDEGTVMVKELKGDLDLVVEYGGNCVTCPSSIGSTLNALTSILRAKVHPDLRVTPAL